MPSYFLANFLKHFRINKVWNNFESCTIFYFVVEIQFETTATLRAELMHNNNVSVSAFINNESKMP